MINYPIFLYILAGELFVLIIVVGLIAIHRLRTFFFQTKAKRRKKILTDYIFSLVEGKKEPSDIPYPGKPSWDKQLLQVLESFDAKIKGVEWLKIRFLLAKEHLIPKAVRYAKKSSWIKRNFAARAFAMAPLEEHLQLIVALAKDKEFIVQGPASLALISTATDLGIHKALYAIAHEQGYERYFYEDLLLYKPDEVIQKVVEFAKDPDLHKACLQVLAHKSWSIKIPFLKDDLTSVDPKMRRLGFAVLLNNEFEDREKHFQMGLMDADEEVIHLCLQGICNYPVEPVIPRLQELINHPSWKVRLAAARALKKAGEHLLQSQAGELAKEAVQYVAEFG